MPRDNATPKERIAALAPNQARITLNYIAEQADKEPPKGYEPEPSASLIEALNIAETYAPTN